uniref:Uncharacterized protein n=1 Tax=Anguilla anguilla TaxID=7936 RepID=A0A0E9PP43_ANGAN
MYSGTFCRLGTVNDCQVKLKSDQSLKID